MTDEQPTFILQLIPVNGWPGAGTSGAVHFAPTAHWLEEQFRPYVGEPCRVTIGRLPKPAEAGGAGDFFDVYCRRDLTGEHLTKVAAQALDGYTVGNYSPPPIIDIGIWTPAGEFLGNARVNSVRRL